MIAEKRCRHVRNRNEYANNIGFHHIIFCAWWNSVEYFYALYRQIARGRHERCYDSYRFMATNDSYIVLRDRNSDRRYAIRYYLAFARKT